MENFERVEKQQKVTYLKYRFIEKHAELYLTEKDIVLESRKSAFRGLGLLNKIPHFKFLTRKKELVIPIGNIESVSQVFVNKNLVAFELIDKKGKEYKFEMKNHEEWIDVINEKLDVLRN